MPSKPQSRCTRCKKLHHGAGRCDECQALQRRASNRVRGSATAQGYGTEHREKFRAPVLARDPVCVICRQAPSTVADHWPLSRKELIAQGADPNDPQYGRGLCRPCDSAQTARRQPGGWNRRPAP